MVVGIAPDRPLGMISNSDNPWDLGYVELSDLSDQGKQLRQLRQEDINNLPR